ncbi:MAG TPA: c-type cytochrome [Candidatus Eisenbacteria bacterium]
MWRTITLTVLALVLAVVLALAVVVASRQHLRFDVPYPPVAASTDPAVIERGRYVVRDVANCAVCHGDPARYEALTNGEEVALIGGHEWAIPPGRFYARNLTPDSATGLGRAPAGAIARALRDGVGNDGRALLPFMEMQGLADDDLAAVVSYLETLAPVRHEVPPHAFNLMGMLVRATVLARPVGPKETPPRVAPRGATVENGRYLVEPVANCWACHTQRNMMTGAPSGPRLAGATEYEDPVDPTRTWSPPNLTRDPATGVLARFSEDAFVARFRTGRLLPGSPMPWQGFRRLSDDDLRAIYRYLSTLPPVRRDVGPPVVARK